MRFGKNNRKRNNWERYKETKTKQYWDCYWYERIFR